MFRRAKCAEFKARSAADRLDWKRTAQTQGERKIAKAFEEASDPNPQLCPGESPALLGLELERCRSPGCPHQLCLNFGAFEGL